ncbi:MAG: hypothetical protein ACTSRK_20185 [Promethearchaeota archaeon]
MNNPTPELPSICNRPNEDCKDCTLDQNLFCTLSWKDSFKFGIGFVILITGMVWGIINAQLNGKITIWATIGIIGGYFIFLFGFLQVWENRILCSHCPYYGREGESVLHCYANFGLRKLFKYRPEPMSKSEKIQFLIGVGIIIFYPKVFLSLLKEYLFLIITSAGVIIWFFLLVTQTCPRCPNFSCPLNRVPKKTIMDYLKKNDRMREAWIKAGWKMED